MMNFLEQWGALVTFLGLLGIEIMPIKIKPLSWLLRKAGKLLNNELIEKVDLLNVKVVQLERANDFKEILDIKQNLSNYKVLLLQNGLDENQYRRCFELETKYNFYKEKYPGEVNGHMDALMEVIHENYKNENILHMNKIDKKR